MKKVLYFAWLFTFLGINLFIPNVGKNAFALFGFKAFVLIILGILPFIVIFVSIKNEKKQDASQIGYNKEDKLFVLQKKEKISLGILAIIILLPGIICLSQYLKDLDIGEQHITLKGCTVNRQHVTTKGGGNTKYYLEGWNLTTKYKFDLKGLSKSQRESLTKTTGKIDITFYPNTKVLVDFEYEIDPDKTTVSYKHSSQSDASLTNAELIRKMANNPEKYIGSQSLYENKREESASENDSSAIDEIVAESNLPFELLSNAEAPNNYSNTNRKCGETEDGYASAYCGHFPVDSENYVINKITIRGGDYNVLGIKVGDSLDNDLGMMFINKHYNMEITSLEKYCYPIPDGCHEYIQSKGNVIIYIYYDEDRVIQEIRVYVTDGNILYLDYDKDQINIDK